MVIVSNFPNAYKEVYTILQYVDKDDVALIPEKLMSTIKAKMNNNYEFEYDSTRSFDEQNVLKETKAIFSYIFLNYWANQAQAQMIKEQFKKDIENAELEKQEKYNYDNLFSKRERTVQNITENIATEQTAMVEYKENIFVRIKNWFRRIFLKH